MIVPNVVAKYLMKKLIFLRLNALCFVRGGVVWQRVQAA